MNMFEIAFAQAAEKKAEKREKKVQADPYLLEERANQEAKTKFVFRLKYVLDAGGVAFLEDLERRGGELDARERALFEEYARISLATGRRYMGLGEWKKITRFEALARKGS